MKLCSALVLLALTPLSLAGQEPPAEAEEPTPETAQEEDSQRTEINLLGETASDSGESRRNENVQFNLVDNNALKELNLRLGTTATIVEDFRADRGYFAAEFGKPPTPPIHAPAARGSGVHGNVFWRHNNSQFSARSFFQVGDVRPARENFYGGTITTPVWSGGFLTLNGSQNKIRGNVNGNILIPLPEERTPLTNDPALRAEVQRRINAYPAGPPNRPDIADRAHNANALQSINTDSARIQLDQSLGDDDKLTFRYAGTAQNVDAFQLV